MQGDAVVELVLITERLVLRRFTASDTEGLLALDSDPEVTTSRLRQLPGHPACVRDHYLGCANEVRWNGRSWRWPCLVEAAGATRHLEASLIDPLAVRPGQY